jgi:hypothetical protein
MADTDLRLLTDMLRRANVTYVVVGNDWDAGVEYDKRICMPGDGEGPVIEKFTGDPDRTRGYSGFQSEMLFDASGQLVAVGAWE